MTIQDYTIQDQIELFRALGRIEQSVKNIERRLAQGDAQHSSLSKRIGSLERSRVWFKAWTGGAAAVSAAAASVALELYHIFARQYR